MVILSDHEKLSFQNFEFQIWISTWITNKTAQTNLFQVYPILIYEPSKLSCLTKNRNCSKMTKGSPRIPQNGQVRNDSGSFTRPPRRAHLVLRKIRTHELIFGSFWSGYGLFFMRVHPGSFCVYFGSVRLILYGSAGALLWGYFKLFVVQWWFRWQPPMLW